MKESEKLEYCIQYSMCITGGFIAAYAVLNHSDFLASAQTANLINVTLCITGRNFTELFLRLIAVFIYMAGLLIPVLLSKYTHINTRIFCILSEVAMVMLLFFFTKSMNTIVALYPVFFMAAMQWNSFPGAGGFASSSIFSTNNLRQFTISLAEYILDKDKGQVKKIKFFGGVLLAYHIGVAVSYFIYIRFAMKGIIFCLIPLFMGIFFLAIRNGIFIGIKREIAAARRTIVTSRS